MNEDENNENIEIVIGDHSELNFSEIKDSIKSLRPKDKESKKNIIIPKSKKNSNEDID